MSAAHQILSKDRTIDGQHHMILNRDDAPLRHRFFPIINFDLPRHSLNRQITQCSQMCGFKKALQGMRCHIV